MENGIDLKKLTPEQLAQVMADAKAIEKQRKEQIREERRAYKDVVNEQIPALFDEYKRICEQKIACEERIMSELEIAKQMKRDTYGADDDQQSDTFTADCGKSIKVGDRVNDFYDDTVHAGIAKVKEFINSLVQDENTERLVKAVMRLIRKDDKGNLKPERIAELRNVAKDFGEPELLMEGLDIIEESYKPVRSRRFITCRFKDGRGAWQDLQTSIV